MTPDRGLHDEGWVWVSLGLQVMNCINRLNVLDSQWLRDKAV